MYGSLQLSVGYADKMELLSAKTRSREGCRMERKPIGRSEFGVSVGNRSMTGVAPISYRRYAEDQQQRRPMTAIPRTWQRKRQGLDAAGGELDVQELRCCALADPDAVVTTELKVGREWSVRQVPRPAFCRVRPVVGSRRTTVGPEARAAMTFRARRKPGTSDNLSKMQGCGIRVRPVIEVVLAW